MDYPSDPTVGLVNGKFTDGDPVSGVEPSRDTAAWANAVTDEILSAINALGMAPDEGDTTQLGQVLALLAASKLDASRLPNVNEDVTASDEEMNFLVGLLGNVQAQINDTAGRRGALTYKTSDQAISGNTSVTFDSEKYDSSGIHDASTNTDRLTVPSGVSRVRIAAHLTVSSTVWDGEVYARILKNGSALFAGGAEKKVVLGLNQSYADLATAVIDVSAGDYFTLLVSDTSSGNVTVNSSASGVKTWFSMEVIA